MYINLPDKLYYKIGEVAKAFNVKPSLIRYWEKEFKILHPKKNKKGNRIFTKKDIDVIRQIYILVKEKGYTHDGAKLKLRENTHTVSHKNTDKQAVVSKLEKIKHELQQIKNHL